MAALPSIWDNSPRLNMAIPEISTFSLTSNSGRRLWTIARKGVLLIEQAKSAIWLLNSYYQDNAQSSPTAVRRDRVSNCESEGERETFGEFGPIHSQTSSCSASGMGSPSSGRGGKQTLHDMFDRPTGSNSKLRACGASPWEAMWGLWGEFFCVGF
ncbi:hypothetical protein BCR34DRAFT_588326 [Clohesyomyces aquaticus]|uniref:Uncharacterized protein n=1 Tax=Clohesyomyces aquaticus TaxID=1231657 RepID=A0A1Y1ZL28_9PLEO|nr:hypothetical protein BCR34DRAFT_588326 [Clohesyomyces aquaticus]